MNVDRARVAEVIEAPNLVKKLIAREHAVIVGGKEIEKLQLLGGDVDRFAAQLKLVFLQADLDIFKFDDLVISNATSPADTASAIIKAMSEPLITDKKGLLASLYEMANTKNNNI